MKNHRELCQALLDGETITITEEASKRIHAIAEWKMLDDTIVELNETDYMLASFSLDELMIKPKTININGFEVPEPCRKPLADGVTYYYFNTCYPENNYVDDLVWENDRLDLTMLALGLIHLTKEAAIQHAKALLSFTEVK